MLIDHMKQFSVFFLLWQLQHVCSHTTDYAGYFDIKKPLFTDTDQYGVRFLSIFAVLHVGYPFIKIVSVCHTVVLMLLTHAYVIKTSFRNM